VQHFIAVSRFAEAREAIEIGRRLGIEGAAADPLFHVDARAQIELGALAPAAAREHAGALVADPRFYASLRGGLVLVAADLEEGHLTQAASAMRENAERQRDQGNLAEAAMFSLPALRLARWLDRPIDPAHVAMLERILAERTDVPPHIRLQIVAELALARRTKGALEEALRTIEEAAEREADGETLARERALVLGLSLVRAAHGDAAAVERWKATDHAPYAARRAASLDAALALVAVGDTKGAEAAYQMGADPTNSAEDAGQRMIAIARLAILYRREGRAEEAAAREAILTRLWSSADAGLLDAVKRMR
jgi:hypothetical protein